MQEKTNTIAETSARQGLKIHRGKSKILKVNEANTTPIRLEGEALEEVKSFIYIGNIADKQGGTDVDIRPELARQGHGFSSAEERLGIHRPDNQTSRSGYSTPS